MALLRKQPDSAISSLEGRGDKFILPDQLVSLSLNNTLISRII